MKKTPSPQDPWDNLPVEPQPEPQPQPEPEPLPRVEYDLEGLRTDFPTARDLERFVYDETGVVLNLKGRSNDIKYSVALAVLNGNQVAPEFLGRENPYVDRAEMVPTDPLQPAPDRAAELPPLTQVQNQFHTKRILHPDPEYRARDRHVWVCFRKYKSGEISYEIEGPIEPRAVGEKMDKFGKMRPELMTWVDPRTGEQIAMRRDGTLTPLGRNLRAIMQRMRVNNSNQWDTWIDRDFVTLESGELANPWDLKP